MDHEWTMKFVEHRVADNRVLRLIRKWLKAGVSEDGEWSETKVGTPQGGGGIAAAGERVPAPRFRSVGGGLARESGEGGHGCGPLRRRSRSEEHTSELQ